MSNRCLFSLNCKVVDFTISIRFFEEYGFPGVIGCIDCTHVAIVPPKRDDPEYPEHLYVNRKGYHSINVQLVSLCKNIICVQVGIYILL